MRKYAKAQAAISKTKQQMKPSRTKRVDQHLKDIVNDLEKHKDIIDIEIKRELNNDSRESRSNNSSRMKKKVE